MKKAVPYLRIATVVCALAAALTQTLAMFTLYEPQTHYFTQGSILPALSVLFALLGAIAGSVAAIFTERASLARSPFSTEASRAPMAIGFLAPAALLLPFAAPAMSQHLVLLSVVLLALATVYGIMTNIPAMRVSKPQVAVVFGFAAVLGCIVLNAYYYFDSSIEMNAPIKVSTQVGLLCAMLYLTGELRYLLGNPMPRMFLTLSAWTVSPGAISAVSVPIAYFVGLTNRIDYLCGAVLTLCVLLTALLRTNTLLKGDQTTKIPNDTQDDSDTLANNSDVTE